MINRLNQVLGPLNWSFRVTERGQTERKNEKTSEGEVWVYGELTIHDHKSGASVVKGQFGQHPIHANVPIGDAYKAAETDSLKKTVDYEKVYAYVGSVIHSKKNSLIEALVYTIARGIIREFFNVEMVTVKVRKPHPPVKGVVDYVEVEMTERR